MTKIVSSVEVPRPWFREPWPWLLMAGPFVVIVAAFVTAWIAVRSNDGLVTDDYYKKGLVVDQTLAKSRLADELGISAKLRLSAERVEVRLASTAGETVSPASLRVTLSHPTRAGLDQSADLGVSDGSVYAGQLRLPASGHWLVLIEDDAQTWRLMGNVVLPAQGETAIGGPSPSKGG